MVVDYVAAPVEKNYALRDIFPYELHAKPELMSLRLVSRDFCAAASRHLSEYATHVRYLKIGPDSFGLYDGPSLGQVEDLAGLLSPCLAHLSDLRILRFRASCSSLTRLQEETAIETITTALRYVVLPHLEGLELFFPLTHDFRHFFPSNPTPLHIPMEDILRRLRYLALHVAAFLKSSDSVLITFDHFRALVDQCKGHLEYIKLTLMQLHSGTWQSVLTQLCQLPHLIDFYIKSCGYPATGPNAHLCDMLPEPDNPVDLETKNSADDHALEELRKFINANRVAMGRDPLERLDYR
ncbi:hypothetical protein BJY04DRAFT_228584 [Aspergillus karnatakaensis]|uniref:uncharacterized protein n=1 Tax=Aspergillus karnatakaensis TaxID=1810916 RepID=UPI003CCD6BBA